MRATAILRPGTLTGSMIKFERLTGVEWTSAIAEADLVVIFGGDGTIHRHLSELVERAIPLLVVPCGSGNDFARALGIKSSKDSLEAFRRFENDGRAMRRIDLGVICGRGAAAPVKSYFCCVAGVGIDGNIARRANRLPGWLRGRLGYALSAPPEFLRFEAARMKVIADGTSRPSNPTILAAVANTPGFGGGMQIAPRASLNDGKLDLCVVGAMSVLKLLYLFPTVYMGRHLRFEEVEYMQAESARIESEYPLEVWADGEYICQTPVSFGLTPKALQVLTSAPVSRLLQSSLQD